MAVISQQAIEEFLGQHAKSGVRRGKNHLNSNKVESIIYDKPCSHLEGVVCASMRKQKYKITFELKGNGRIASATCECARATKCAHMVALLLKARQEISPTDVECRWSKRAAPKEDLVCTVASLSKRKTFDPQYGDFNPEAFVQLREDLKNCPEGSGAGVLFLLEEEPETTPPLSPPTDEQSHLTPDAQEVIIRSNGDGKLIRESLAVGWSDINSIASKTAGQSSNILWKRVRRGRLTASRFGAILRAMKRRGGPAPSESLLSFIKCDRNIDHVKAIQWGRIHEKTALNQYSSMSGKTVVQTGIWLHESGCFGASPYGLIDDDTVLEIKCPYSFRNKRLAEVLSIVIEAEKGRRKEKYPYAVSFKGGRWYVNEEHDYYHQIQAAIHFTKREKGILFVWTPKDNVTCLIPKDLQWLENVAALDRFFFDFFVPYVVSV